MAVRRRGLTFAGLASDLVMNTIVFVVFVVSVSATLLWGAVMWWRWRGPGSASEPSQNANQKPGSRSRLGQNREGELAIGSGKHSDFLDSEPVSDAPHEAVPTEKSIPLKKHKLSDDGVFPLNDNARQLSASMLERIDRRDNNEDEQSHQQIPDVPAGLKDQSAAVLESEEHNTRTPDNTHDLEVDATPRRSSSLRTPLRPETDWQVTAAQKADTPARRGQKLRQILRPLGGEPGSITTGQQIVVQSFLGRPAPEWMSEHQARVLLSVRYCCEHILLNVMGPHDDAIVDPDVLRRLTVTVVSDQTIRDQVVAWDAQAGLDSNGKPVYRHRDPKTVRLVEGFARKLLEDGTEEAIETSRKSA